MNKRFTSIFFKTHFEYHVVFQLHSIARVKFYGFTPPPRKTGARRRAAAAGTKTPFCRRRRVFERLAPLVCCVPTSVSAVCQLPYLLCAFVPCHICQLCCLPTSVPAGGCLPLITINGFPLSISIQQCLIQ